MQLFDLYGVFFHPIRAVRQSVSIFDTRSCRGGSIGSVEHIVVMGLNGTPVVSGGLRGPTAPTNPLLALDSCEAISDVRYELDAGRGFVNEYGRVVVLRACVENSQHFRSRKVDEDMAAGVATAALVACARGARIGRSGRRFSV